MNPMERSTVERRMLLAGALVVGLTAGLASAGAARIVQPLRREARITLGTRNNATDSTAETLDAFFGTEVASDLDYYAADLVLPAATTAELVAYARRAGRRKAIDWFCETYATAPADAPTSASLRTMLVLAASEGGAEGGRAGDALLCPSAPEPPLRGLAALAMAIFQPILAMAGHDPVTLAFATCAGSDDMRAAFDAAGCSALLRGPRVRRRAFIRAAHQASRRGQCLRVRAYAARRLLAGETAVFALGDEHDAFVAVGPTAEDCE
jgi:hypothetical protein